MGDLHTEGAVNRLTGAVLTIAVLTDMVMQRAGGENRPSSTMAQQRVESYYEWAMAEIVLPGDPGGDDG